MKYGERVWTWREHLAEASATAAALIHVADPDRPLHVGALQGNTPEMLTATPQQDDHQNPLRVAFGNEASDRDIAEFSRRFDCTVWDGFESTEGAIIITREDGCPTGSLGGVFPVSAFTTQTPWPSAR